MNNAGFHSVQTMASYLCRPVDDVELLLATVGLDGVLLCPEVKQCPACGVWRTSFYRGKCRICSLRDSIAAAESKCAEVFELLPPEIKETYSRAEVFRSPRVFDAAPKPPERKSGISPIQKRLDLVAYTVAVEQFETNRLQRTYGAVRQRLKRMREKIGANPRLTKQ